jgi:LmbE family N-acetylglucosaminyl deacetylase
MVERRLKNRAVIMAKEAAGSMLRVAASRLGQRIEFGPRGIVVVAPHCDDEVLGCGGLLMAARASGVATCVVIAAAGADPDRRDESRAGLVALGLDPQCARFLDHRDATLSEHVDDLADQLAAIIASVEPTAVYTTSSWDPHPDHAALGRAVAEACIRSPQSPAVFEYAIWQWESPRLVLRWLRAGDLGPVAAMRALRVLRVPDRARKRASLSKHRSQLEPSPDGVLALDSGVTRRFLGRCEFFRPGPAPDPGGPTMAGWALPGERS